MGNVAASGIIATVLDTMRDQIAACSAFQSWVNEADATHAKDRVHIVAFDPDTQDWPFAHVYCTDDWQSNAIAGGGSHTFEVSRSIDVHFEAEVPSVYSHDPDDAMLDFLNNIGEIIEDIQDLAGTGSYLAIQTIRMVEPAWRSHEDDQVTDGDIHGITFRFEWGL